MPTVFNAANEVADDAFIKGQIPFLAMADLIEGRPQQSGTCFPIIL